MGMMLLEKDKHRQIEVIDVFPGSFVSAFSFVVENPCGEVEVLVVLF